MLFRSSDMEMFCASPSELTSPILSRASPRINCHFRGLRAPGPSSLSAMSRGCRTIVADVPSFSADWAARTWWCISFAVAISFTDGAGLIRAKVARASSGRPRLV